MAGATIYTVADGKLTAMQPSAPENEDTMQRLIAQHPSIISDRDGPLLLIKREQPISDTTTGSGRWSLDHLFVTQEGVPVLVELKRAVDTRLRREVVGQMLDYAANATVYWRAGTIAEVFQETVRDLGGTADEILAEFLGSAERADEFWTRVDDSFAAGRMKLVFVADVIPRELARIVEFLNEQMKCDVRAVELNWFEGQGIKAFAPRIIGETERAQAAKQAGTKLPPMSPEDWIVERVEPLGPGPVSAANEFLKMLVDAGGEPHVPHSRGSLRIKFVSGLQKPVYPIGFEVGKDATVFVNFDNLRLHKCFDSPEQRRAFYQEIEKAVGPLSTSNLEGFPSFPAKQLLDPSIRDELTRVLIDLRVNLEADRHSLQVS